MILVPPEPPPWQAITREEIDRWFDLQRLPPDAGIVAPIAAAHERPDPIFAPQLDRLRRLLPEWEPGTVGDPVQRVRNFLYVAAVPDVLKMDPLERFVPLVVFERLQKDIPKDELVKVLYWVARHPYQGDDSAVYELEPLGLRHGPDDMETIRERVTFYALKLLGRVTGKEVGGRR